ncbi:MAG TPA: DUF5110 domain-containing protein, partial [Steroidobacteraceae bacterium]|nr:DUF5110 domain-containing protein [Steroidobacteraceae bacterium]
PVFVRAGAVIPEQRASEYSDARPLDALILKVYGSGDGRFELYEDDGASLNSDEAGQHALTTLSHTIGADGVHHLVIEPVVGAYAGQPAQRSYELRLLGAARPASLAVNGVAAGQWSWDSARSIASTRIGSRPIHERLDIAWR